MRQQRYRDLGVNSIRLALQLAEADQRIAAVEARRERAAVRRSLTGCGGGREAC